MSLNKTGNIMLNELRNEFVFINEGIEIPQINVKGITDNQKSDLAEKFNEIIPDYIRNHELLFTPRPKNEIYSIQFVRPIKGDYFDFLHFFNIDLKFSGDSTQIIDMGNPDYFPSYKTDRIYYKSFLMPVERNDFSSDMMESFSVDKAVDKVDMDVDQSFHTYAMFDEVDTSGIIEKIYSTIGFDNINISYKLYSFFRFISLTIAFNVLDPVDEKLDAALELYEPVWLFLKSNLNKSFKEFALKNRKIKELFSGKIDFDEDKLLLKDVFKESMVRYFSKFSFKSDDELAVKRWVRVEV